MPDILYGSCMDSCFLGLVTTIFINLQKPPEIDIPPLEITDAEKEVKSMDPELLDLQTNVF